MTQPRFKPALLSHGRLYFARKTEFIYKHASSSHDNQGNQIGYDPGIKIVPENLGSEIVEDLEGNMIRLEGRSCAGIQSSSKIRNGRAVGLIQLRNVKERFGLEPEEVLRFFLEGSVRRKRGSEWCITDATDKVVVPGEEFVVAQTRVENPLNVKGVDQHITRSGYGDWHCVLCDKTMRRGVSNHAGSHLHKRLVAEFEQKKAEVAA